MNNTTNHNLNTKSATSFQQTIQQYKNKMNTSTSRLTHQEFEELYNLFYKIISEKYKKPENFQETPKSTIYYSTIPTFDEENSALYNFLINFPYQQNTKS
jgi:hypothetical protein